MHNAHNLWKRASNLRNIHERRHSSRWRVDLHRSIRLTFSTAQLVRNSRYQQLAEGIERTDRSELERHQMGFAEWQLLQHGVRCLSVGHIQDEDDTRPVFQRIPLVDLAIEIELRGLANLGRQNALNLRHVRARGEGADGQNLGSRRLRHRCLSNGTVGGTSQDRGGSQISERTFDHGRTFLKRVDVRFGSKADIEAVRVMFALPPKADTDA